MSEEKQGRQFDMDLRLPYPGSKIKYRGADVEGVRAVTVRAAAGALPVVELEMIPSQINLSAEQGDLFIRLGGKRFLLAEIKEYETEGAADDGGAGTDTDDNAIVTDSMVNESGERHD